MSTNLLSLLRRDHHELEQGLTELLRVDASPVRLRTALDGVRLGLTAHAEAEDIVLYTAFARFELSPALQMLVEHARVAHIEQEAALAAVVTSPIHSVGWTARVERLRDAVVPHARQEEDHIVPALRDHAPADLYQSLAGAFATERLRQLAMLQPSAPATFYSSPRTLRP